jgi:hypothetical protein
MTVLLMTLNGFIAGSLNSWLFSGRFLEGLFSSSSPVAILADHDGGRPVVCIGGSGRSDAGADDRFRP